MDYGLHEFGRWGVGAIVFIVGEQPLLHNLTMMRKYRCAIGYVVKPGAPSGPGFVGWIQLSSGDHGCPERRLSV